MDQPGVISPAAARTASLADLAGVVAIGVASPAMAGVVALTDIAGGVTVGVASLADAGVASLADAEVASLADAGVASLSDAGVTSLADLVGSVAGGVTDLAVPVRVGSEEMCVVQDHSVFGGLVYGDSEMDCGDCVLPNVWCQGMPAIRDDSVCEYINYVGCDPDCVDRTVPEGGDD